MAGNDERPIARRRTKEEREASVNRYVELLRRSIVPPAGGAAYVAERVSRLLSELNRASSAVPIDVVQERRRYVWVLTQLSKFIKEIGGTFEQASYIRDLAQMLDDLDRGVVHPVMQSCQYGSGKRGDVSTVWRARGQVATGLEALLLSEPGMSRQVAAKSALKDLPRIDRLMATKSKNSLKAVLSWHDDFCRGQSRSKNSEWADTLELGGELLKLCAGNPVALKDLARIQFRLASRI